MIDETVEKTECTRLLDDVIMYNLNIFCKNAQKVVVLLNSVI